jgi:hypothetical protein
VVEADPVPTVRCVHSVSKLLAVVETMDERLLDGRELTLVRY